MICVCSIISVIPASYHIEVNLHGFVKLFKFCDTRKFTLHLVLTVLSLALPNRDTSVKILSTSSM